MGLNVLVTSSDQVLPGGLMFGKHGEILLDQVHGHVDFNGPLCGTLHADGILETKGKIQDSKSRAEVNSDIV